MEQRSMMPAPVPQPGGTWLEAYLPNPGSEPPAPTNNLINWMLIRGILYRQRWIIVSTILAALIAGVVVTLVMPPRYEAVAKVRIAPYGPNILAGQDVEQGIAASQIYDYIATQVQVIKSRSLAKTVATDLKFGERMDLFDENIEEARSPNMSDEEWRNARIEMAASILAAGVVVEPPRDGWIIDIGFRSKNPVLAAEIANGYANAFVATGTRGKVESNAYALEYLEGQIQETRERLEQAELAANGYRRQSGIIVQSTVVGADGEVSDTTINNANLATMNARVSAARAARIEAEQRWRSIQNLPAAQLPEVQSNPVLQGLLQERSAKLAQIADLRQRYNDDFPQIATLLAQTATIDRQLERISDDVKQTVRNAYVVARNQEQALNAELQSITSATLNEQDQQVQLGVLDREAQALREQLRSLLARFNQITSAAEVDTGTFSKLDPAIVPQVPYSPNLTRNIFLALLAGLGLAGGLALIREILDDRARSLDDVELKIGLPLLGHTPYIDDKDIESQGTNRFSSLMEAYSSIRTTIDFAIPRGKNVLQLTSSQASEGKSTSTVILAELFASLGRKTLLIDADLRRPSVASLLDMERPKVGVVEVVLGHVSLEEAVIKGVHENLEILPVGNIPLSPTDVLSSPEFKEFIDRCRSEYSLVLIDSCPVMGLADAPIVSRLVDYTIFVIEANRVPFNEARAAARRIASAGGNVLGVIFTKFRALEAGQSYNYQYGYYEYGGDRAKG